MSDIRFKNISSAATVLLLLNSSLSLQQPAVTRVLRQYLRHVSGLVVTSSFLFKLHSEALVFNSQTRISPLIWKQIHILLHQVSSCYILRFKELFSMELGGEVWGLIVMTVEIYKRDSVNKLPEAKLIPCTWDTAIFPSTFTTYHVFRNSYFNIFQMPNWQTVFTKWLNQILKRTLFNAKNAPTAKGTPLSVWVSPDRWSVFVFFRKRQMRRGDFVSSVYTPGGSSSCCQHSSHLAFLHRVQRKLQHEGCCCCQRSAISFLFHPLS